MKYLLLNCILLTVFSTVLFAQQAQDYFPGETGYKWNYKVTPLDSLNNPIDSLVFFRADSFAVVENYEGRLASIVVTKQGSEEVLPSLPYNDSLFYSFDGTIASEYFRLRGLAELAGLLDSISPGGGSSLLAFFESLKAWYSAFRFTQTVNQQYTLFSKDTTIVLDSLSLPLRFEYRGRRLSDQLIDTELGSFNCKRFLFTMTISYVILPPPFPALQLLQIPDTVWVAQNNWIVKDIISSTELNLAALGYGSYQIPGLRTEIMQQQTTSAGNDYDNQFVFDLDQNYPNPFNPLTNIGFTIPETGKVSLILYDLLGQAVKVIAEGDFSQGRHVIGFDASELASGIYIYRLKYHDSVLSGKMVLMK